MTLLLVLLIALGLFSVALIGGTSLVPPAPSLQGRSFDWTFSTGLSAYDPTEGYIVWLQGDGSTWAYAHGTWSNITPTAGIPVGMLSNTRLTYDARDSYLLLYGGAPPLPGVQPLTNTWAFQGGRWVNLTSSVHGAPPPMVLGPMAYDSEDHEVVLFGGNIVSAPSSSFASNETWTYAAGTWTNATVPGPPSPGGAYGLDPFVALVDDPADGYLLYYDSLEGCPKACGITWTYDAGAWTNRTATFVPSPRLSLWDMFVYDSTTGTIVAQSACESTPTFTCAHAWGTFEFSGGSWKDVTPPVSPGGRDYSGYANDPSDGGVIIVGGCCWADFSGLSLGWSDIWVYSHGNWHESEPWGGGAPTWYENDGTWFAVGLAVVSAGVVLLGMTGRRSKGA